MPCLVPRSSAAPTRTTAGRMQDASAIRAGGRRAVDDAPTVDWGGSWQDRPSSCSSRSWRSRSSSRSSSPSPTSGCSRRTRPSSSAAHNFARLLTVRLLTLEPVLDAASGAPARDEAGALVYPSVRDFTRNNPAYPELDRLQEFMSFGHRRPAGPRPGRRRRLHPFPGQHDRLHGGHRPRPGRARAAAGAAHQQPGAGHQRLPHDLLHPGRHVDGRHLAAVALHLQPAGRPAQRHHRHAHVRGGQAGGLARRHRDRAARGHAHVDVAGGRLPDGHLAGRASRPSRRTSTRPPPSTARVAGRSSSTSRGPGCATPPSSSSSPSRSRPSGCSRRSTS